MARKKWPYAPPSICSMLPGDLPGFLQTGATHTAGRAVTIVDPIVKARAEPTDRFDGFQPFCKCLRGGCPGWTIGPQCDNNCVLFTYDVAAKLLADCSLADGRVGEAVRYRCYLGLEEWAVPFSVGGVKVVMVSGQFAPPEGIEDIKLAVSSLGRCVPQFDALSAEMQETMTRFSPSEDLWVNVRVIDAERKHLLSHAECLAPADDEYGSVLRRCAERVTEITQKYYDMRRTQLEGAIVANIQAAARLAAQRVTAPELWPCAGDILDAVRAELGLAYVAFFSGSGASDTILRLKAHSTAVGNGNESTRWPHFNWRKAGLRTEDGRDGDAQTLDWHRVGLPDRSRLLRGLKGGDPGQLHDASGLIPVRLPGSPLGLLVLGPDERAFDLDPHNDFVMATCQDVATRILTMHLADILTADRTDWQRTAKMTGHRVRASIQSIDSQMKILDARNRQDPNFSPRHAAAAEAELDRALEALTEVSYAAESSVPGAVDVRIARRERLELADIIEDAVASQQHLATKHGIRIEVADSLVTLRPVYGNRGLLRYVFMNLINNGLKYSYYFEGSRTLDIKPYRGDAPLKEVEVEVVNYGLGIKREDHEHIFEWGVRLVEGAPDFEETYGKGLGLWECRHVVEGHGGVITVESVHRDKSPVTDQNISKCITVFRVSLPEA